MKLTKSKFLLLSIITISLSLTLVSCNKKDIEVIEKEQVTSTENSITENNSEEITLDSVAIDIANEKNVEESTTATLINKNELNIKSLGFEFKDNFLYYNGNLVSNHEITSYSIDQNIAKFTNSKGTLININKDGSLQSLFAAGIKIEIAPSMASFVFTYKDFRLELPTIQKFIESDTWNTLEVSDEVSLKFNDTTVIVYIDNISFTFVNDKVTTKYKDISISNSPISNIVLNIPSLEVNYEDESSLNHKIGDGTKFTLKNGDSIYNDESATTFTTKESTKVLDGELISIVEDMDEETITFSTIDDSYTLYLSDTELNKDSDSVSQVLSDTTSTEEEEKTLNGDEEAIIEDTVNMEEDIAFEDNQQTISLASSTDNFDFPSLFETTIDKPYRIGLMLNYTSFYGKVNDTLPSEFTTFGLRSDLVIEKEFYKNWEMGFEIGVGADKFDSGYVKQLVPMFTITRDYNLLKSNTIRPYARIGVGSLIFIDEDDLYPFFRAKVGGGLNLDFTQSLVLSVGANYNFLYRSDIISHAFDAQVGLKYKF